MSRARQEVVRQIRALRAVAFKPRRRAIPRQTPPLMIEVAYGKAIRSYLDRARALVLARVLPNLPGWLSELRVDAKGMGETVDEISQQYFDAVRPHDVEQLATSYAKRTGDWNREQLAKQTRAAFGVDIFAAEPNIEPKVRAFTAENVALIKSVPNSYFDRVEKTITRGAADGLRATEIAKQLSADFSISEDRAALIARDQVGKFYGTVNEIRQVNLGIERYYWRTVHDDRVRPEHEDLDGTLIAWDDEPEDGHPGQPINCRCFADPDFSGILEGLS